MVKNKQTLNSIIFNHHRRPFDTYKIKKPTKQINDPETIEKIRDQAETLISEVESSL